MKTDNGVGFAFATNIQNDAQSFMQNVSKDESWDQDCGVVQSTSCEVSQWLPRARFDDIAISIQLAILHRPYYNATDPTDFPGRTP
jgi:hypothetical protein